MRLLLECGHELAQQLLADDSLDPTTEALGPLDPPSRAAEDEDDSEMLGRATPMVATQTPVETLENGSQDEIWAEELDDDDVYVEHDDARASC